MHEPPLRRGERLLRSGQGDRSVNLITHLDLVPRLRVSGAAPSRRPLRVRSCGQMRVE